MSRRVAHPPHPGEITIIDLIAGTQRVEAAANVPEAMAFAETPDGPVPVVRIEVVALDGRRTLESYDAAGRLLSSTLQLA